MLDAELCNKRINGANLHAITSARITKHCCLNMCLAGWIEERKHLQAINDARLIFGAVEALQELLNHDTGCNDSVAVQKCSAQDSNSSML